MLTCVNPRLILLRSFPFALLSPNPLFFLRGVLFECKACGFGYTPGILLYFEDWPKPGNAAFGQKNHKNPNCLVLKYDPKNHSELPSFSSEHVDFCSFSLKNAKKSPYFWPFSTVQQYPEWTLAIKNRTFPPKIQQKKHQISQIFPDFNFPELLAATEKKKTEILVATANIFVHNTSLPNFHGQN